MQTITKDTPEPDYGMDYVLILDARGVIETVIHCEGEDTWIDDCRGAEDTCYLWNELAKKYAGCRMETLAAHDKRIRCEALKLTADEASLAYATCVDATVHTRLSPQEIMIKAFAAVANSRELEA